MITTNWALALVEQGKIDAAWTVAQADEGLPPDTTREQWIEWATATVAKRHQKEARYLRPAEVSKMVRSALKVAFPGVKFSVTTRHGSSVSVRWVDGPTFEQVHKVADRFNGKDFDGMDDSTHYRQPIEIDGELVRSYCYVMESRHESAEFTRRVGEAYSAETGWEVPEIYPEGGFVLDNCKPVPGGYEPVAAWFNRKLWATAEGELE